MIIDKANDCSVLRLIITFASFIISHFFPIALLQTMKKSTTIVLSLFFLVLVFVTVQGEEENVDEVLFSDDDVFDYNLFSKRGFKHPFARFLRSSPIDDGQVPETFV